MANATTARLDKYFQNYASHHRTPGNKITHYVGIPIIVMSTLGLLATIELGGIQAGIFQLDVGVLLWAVGLIWYFTLDWKLALLFGPVALGLYFLGRGIPTPVNWAIFVFGWIVQFIGHYVYEKQSPAFFDNLMHLLIGPLWIFARMIGYIK